MATTIMKTAEEWAVIGWYGKLPMSTTGTAEIVRQIQTDALHHAARRCELVGNLARRQMEKNGAYACSEKLREEAKKLEAQ